MTTKNKPIRKKPKSFTPIIFKINKEQQDVIKRPPRTSLNRFRDNRADATDWYNIAFRIRVGVHIARTEYVQDTINEMNQAFTLCDLIYTNAKKETGPDWTIGQEQVDILEATLDAVDIMQDETTRRVQLDAHLVTQKLMRVYVNAFDVYAATVNKTDKEVT